MRNVISRELTMGQFIARERKKRGMSQKDLAAKLNMPTGGTMSPQFLSDIEHGKRKLGESFLAQVAELFEVPIEQLYLRMQQLPPNLIVNDDLVVQLHTWLEEHGVWEK